MLVALGSNVRHRRHGRPERVLAAAIVALAAAGLAVERVAPVIATAPVGPSARRYANGAALVRTTLPPDRLLVLLKAIERAFGRRRGRKWAARVLDLDLILWDGGNWRGPGLAIPHREYARRGFVLGPASRIAPDWREARGGPTLRQRNARLTRPRPLPKRGVPEGRSPGTGP